MAGINPVRVTAAAPRKSKHTISMPKDWDIQVRYNTPKKFFIERAPRQQLISMEGERYLLWMPWTYYKVTPETNSYLDYEPMVIRKIWVSPNKVNDDSSLYRLPLSNIYEGERPCYSHYVQGRQDSVQLQIAETILVWDSQNFNYDNWERAQKNPVYKHLSEWADVDGKNYRSYRDVLRQWEKLDLSEVKKLPWHAVSTVRTATASKAEKVLRSGVKYPR